MTKITELERALSQEQQRVRISLSKEKQNQVWGGNCLFRKQNYNEPFKIYKLKYSNLVL